MQNRQSARDLEHLRYGLSRLVGDVKEDADSGEGEEEACADGGDEGEGYSLCGQEREHYADVEEGLEERNRW